ncbi:hypothetical protein EDB86DRAFT_1160190 [Lactarius hatsudake]|nr:hypothetical protein EDB86DRAFT_1160190 [Lactarius hatsudake]
MPSRRVRHVAVVRGSFTQFSEMIMYFARCTMRGEKRLKRVSSPTLGSTTVSMSAAPTSAPSPPRSTRPLAARKRHNDPTWFSSAPPVPSVKRQATDRVESEQRKRKRVEPAVQAPSQLGSRIDRPQEKHNEEPPVMDFTTLPPEALHRYLVQYDLIPMVHPSPLTVHDPPPPPSLLESTTRSSSRGLSPPVTTPANRPRRESREQSRRRSSRILEGEVRMRTPVLADVGEVQNVLASIAQRHFESQVVKEVDSLASFMCAVKGKVTLTGAI